MVHSGKEKEKSKRGDNRKSETEKTKEDVKICTY